MELEKVINIIVLILLAGGLLYACCIGCYKMSRKITKGKNDVQGRVPIRYRSQTAYSLVKSTHDTTEYVDSDGSGSDEVFYT